jgi:hypothetical protein
MAASRDPAADFIDGMESACYTSLTLAVSAGALETMLPSYCYGTAVVFNPEITVSFQKERLFLIDTTKGSCPTLTS